MNIPFYKHNVGDEEIQAVISVLRSPIHTAGPVTKQFEQEFAHYLGCRHAAGVTSWTMGAFLCLKALGIGPGDEVITVPLSFISTANVICHAGARPVFVDVDPLSGLMDVQQMKEAITPQTKAIIPVHLYGAMCDMRAIAEIADKNGIPVIEDAAHCIEGMRDGIRPGQLSKAACFSFYATKNMGCGDGGAVVTNDDKLAAQVACLRFHGMTRGSEERYSGKYRHYDMPELGYKCNLTDIQAAMLSTQLPKLTEYLVRKEYIAQRYEKSFAKLSKVSLMACPPRTAHARHIFTILVSDHFRDQCIASLQEHGIGVAVHFNPIHLSTYYLNTYSFQRGDFPNAENIGLRSITLPLYPKLKEFEVDYVIEAVTKTVAEY